MEKGKDTLFSIVDDVYDVFNDWSPYTIPTLTFQKQSVKTVRYQVII